MGLKKDEPMFCLFSILCCSTEILYVFLYHFPKNFNYLYNKYILISIFCFIIYFAKLYIVNKISNYYSAKLLYLIFCFGLIFRLTLIYLPPFLSDDIYRYIWDGYIQKQGINPYLYSPNAIELRAFRNTVIFPFINHPYLPTIYPPLSQWIFFLAHLISGNSFLGIKVIILFFDVGTALLIVNLLKYLKLPTTKVAVYFLCPLPILEFFISGHIDSVGIFFFVLFLYLIITAKFKLASISLASSCLIKIMPIIFIPIALYYQLNKKKTISFLCFFSLVLFLFYFPHYLSIQSKVLGSFSTFIRDFYFNSSIFSLLHNITKNSQLSALICYLGLGIWVLIATFKSEDFIKGVFWILTGIYIFSPIVHPWYLTWIVPLLIFVPSKAFFWLIMSCQFSYRVLIGYHQENIWQDSLLIKLVEYLPFFALLSYDLLRLQAKKIISQEKNHHVNI